MEQSARQIAETLLESTGKAMLNKNFELFAQSFHFPYHVETIGSKSVMTNTAELRAFFDCVCQDHTRKGATDLVRICEVAEFRNEARVDVTHITHVMAGDQRVSDPFPIFSIIENINGTWKVTATQLAVDLTTHIGRAVAQLSAPAGSAVVETHQG